MLRFVAATLLFGALAAVIRAQDSDAQALPAIGTDGGTSFTRQCPAGQVLTGIRARAGVVIEALGISCRPINANGTLGTESSVGTMAGGAGGTDRSGSCPSGSVVSGQAGVKAVPAGVASFDLRCRRWDATTRRFTGGIVAVIHVVAGTGSRGVAVDASPGVNVPTFDCLRQQQPAVLLRGRAGAIVDAAGLTCNNP